ncbi:MAG: FAD-binding protein [Candidatus Abyssobacteria bacterium SURF_5]|uniref:FAD-binding protein n=1 Tax=Abyssobacteria bacterium (strain SURF_5) TaxID=2093360 RepID=A0A3A4NLU7_ABYX5|nr:MAG: FAD-binding protein [Candidatus Abyssubacteria bacterium SURF_5]
MFECDVLCIGAGGAGLVAAATAAGTGSRTIVISKMPYGCGNTRISGGLVLRPNISPKDSLDSLMRDIIVGGEFLSDQALVHEYCKRAGLAAELMERFGIIFSRNSSGQPAPLPTAMGGHSLPRTLTGYCEGIPIGTALRAAAAGAGVSVLDETLALSLLKRDGSVTGAVCLRWATGEIICISAKQTILATGGLCRLFYPHTSNSSSVTGDGFALALDAGAELVDMEQQQFIPFAITHPESSVGIVCGEPAIAGPYGRLLNARGEEIIKGIRTKTRAEISAAMALARQRGEATGHGGLLLDLSPNLRRPIGKKMFAFIKRTFPSMIDAVRHAYGEEAARGEIPWDVFPTAHYQLGGVRVDTRCRVRGVANLFAAGEVMGGLYGANRIGSTSLAELFIFGSLAGECAAKSAHETERPRIDLDHAREVQQRAGRWRDKKGSVRPVQLMRELGAAMWENVGPVRNASGLEAALKKIEEIRLRSEDVSVAARRDYNPEWLDALELEKMLVTAEAVTRSAFERTETRGGHVRTDFPRRDENRLKSVVVKKSEDSLSVEREDVKLEKYGLETKGGPNPIRERIQFIILGLLPRKTQEKILNARLNLGDSD